ncbi:MAG: hypothetical protein AB4042_03875 [Leptolyngbyaceae cyanobacterium]
MSNFEPVISVCRHCRSYHLEGRRGGFCMQLGTPVQGCWKACSYAIPPFAPSWEVPVGINGDLAHLLWQCDSEPAIPTPTGPQQGQTGEQPTVEVVGTCMSNDDEDRIETTPMGVTLSTKVS